jgi:hypothetical protein
MAPKENKQREHRPTYYEAKKQGLCVDCRRRKARSNPDGGLFSQCQQCVDAKNERKELREKKATKG